MPVIAASSQEPIARARLSLDGLSVGDAFGQCFFSPQEFVTAARVAATAGPPPPWRWTDDTAMSATLVHMLARRGEIDPDELADAFAEVYAADPYRGYGGTTQGLLRSIAAGSPWRETSASLFDGKGSCGNGGAMRAAPAGAYFADADDATLMEQGRRSAEVTHAHPEGQAVAIAVAVAAAFAWRHRGHRRTPALVRAFLDAVVESTPDGAVRSGIAQAADLPRSYATDTAVAVLGNGVRLTAQDTVPLCLWIVARHWGDYPAALWTTVQCGGDRDTTAAIVGGITVMLCGPEGIPPEWRAARKPLPQA
jgi:ADP-ribosylglycohydrolase